jgi:hypothetical protein
MSDPSLVPLILQAWLEYLRLDDLANAEVEPRFGKNQRVFDAGVQVIDNRVLIEKPLFNQLKQIHQDACARGNPEDAQIALAFPKLFRVQGKGQSQKIKYRPLFTIDISSILESNYHLNGWSLLNCDFYPIAANLIELCNLEELEVEQLVVCEGILKFLKDAFGRPFNSLHDFQNQVDLPTSCKASRTAYIVRANLAPYNTQLKNDLRDAYQQYQERGAACSWLQSDHPASRYLFDSAQPPHHAVLSHATLPGKRPDEFQALALKHAQENTLTSVFGPPGSGKTELTLHLLAQPIYKRAWALALGAADLSSLCVFTSTNNSAIDKFQERLDKYFSSSLFYLPGGNRKIISSQTLPKLRAAQDWLEQQAFDSERYEQIKQTFLQKTNELEQKLSEEPELQRRLSADRILLTQIETDLAELQLSAESLEPIEVANPHLASFPVAAYQQIEVALKKAQIELEEGSILKRFLDWLFVNTPRVVFARLERRTRPAWANTQNTAFPFQLPINSGQLQTALEEVQKQLRRFEQWQREAAAYEQRQSQVAGLQHQITDLEAQRQQVQERLTAYPSEDFYTRFYKEHHLLQVQIFEQSWALLQQEAIRRKPEIQTALRRFEQILLSDEDSLLALKLDPQQLYRQLSLVFPVLSSSLQSLANLFPILETDMIRLAILDEAGSTPAHQALPLLIRSQQAVIVGDPQQLYPITNLCPDTIEAYWKSAFQARNLDRAIYSRYAPTAISTATAYHRAAGAVDGNAGQGILLANHYRSVPVIVAFCSPNYPGGLITKTQPRSSLLGPNFLAYSVAGHHVQQTNPDEIEAISAIVALLLKHGYQRQADGSNPVGVMSPFFHQSVALKHRLQKQSQQFSWHDIGTVHQFQGGEKAVVVFSPYQYERNSLGFLNRDTNLLNTAVSRAEELFILVGNLDELDAAGGEIRRLVRHIQKYGEVRDLPSS